MSDGELVTVTVDGREVRVSRGTGIVETAAAAGIEIPVFCYEPRLGPAIGACRMCLCEVEGLPKLQAACTMTAQDGMVVNTAQTSPRAAEGQESVLEFILVNHPLDCPVCDKGGECPLQDLTFRWGPGNTRMTFEKRTLDKPIPISPLIALDRERCILCYRCTRFSEAVSEDGQLIARNRGALSMIATFDDQPYRAPFSGNVIELCPVGALTSTPYRFVARPWEIQNVPTVCGLCPVGCNTYATTREGKVRRILSRNHPDVDGGWLCDKGRFAFGHLGAEDRIADPLRRAGRRRFEDIPWDDALDEAERLIRTAEDRILLAFSGSETVEQVYALSKLVRQGLGSNGVILPEPTFPAFDPFRLPLSAIAEAQVVVVVGDEPVAERAPIVDLWIRAARRRGARIVEIGATPTTDAETARAEVAAAERAVVVWSGGYRTLGAAMSLASGLGERPGSGVIYLPATPNGRGVSDAWAAAGEGEAERPDRVGVLIVSGDEAALDPAIREVAGRADAVIATAMFRRSVAGGWADLVLPGTSYLERDGTSVNLEGRLQRLRRAVIPPAPDELAWISRLAERFGVALSPYPAKVFEELSPRAFGGVSFGEVGERAELPPRPPATPDLNVSVVERRTAGGGPLRLVRYRALFSGPAVERVPELEFQRPRPEVELSPRDAYLRGIASGDPVTVSSNGTSVELRARVNKRLAAGVVRAASEHAGSLRGGVEVSKVAQDREVLRDA